MSSNKNYYFNSFLWSTIQKILNAIVGFLTVPLLLSYFGKEQYGIISIATACNAYMHLLDLGMNNGAVRHFSQWLSLGKKDLVYRVARTNLTFYTIISLINISVLVGIALFGESFFSTTHEQFLQLRSCLFIIALFNIFSWGTTSFNQLLVSAKEIAFTAKLLCVQTLLKIVLIGCVFWFNFTLTTYFFFLTALTASLIIPYAYKCKKDELIDHIRPAAYWSDFKVVLTFSLALFALSLFQMSATQTRPIILSIFSPQGPSVNAEFRIIEVIPQFIITIGGTFSGIFLPKTSEMVARNEQSELSKFAYKWTILTTIVANCLCFPFMLGAKEVLSAYVGAEYQYLSIWLILWICSTLCQIHSTPTNSMILAYGKTKIMVYVSGIACVISMVINAILAPHIGVGSAVIGYCVYIIITLLCYYGFYYKRTLHISRIKIAKSFLRPTICGVFAVFFAYLITQNLSVDLFKADRLNFIVLFAIKTLIWGAFYLCAIIAFRIIYIKNKKVLTKYDI